MTETTIRALAALTRDFYRKNAGSFSHTRQFSWRGWKQVFAELEPAHALHLLDIAAGNLRFEHALHVSCKDIYSHMHCTVLDSCSELVQQSPWKASFEQDKNFIVQEQRSDIIELLLEHLGLSRATDDMGYDLAVSFGFMHHIPSFKLRQQFLAELVQTLRPDGLVAVSFWQFMNNTRIAQKAAYVYSQVKRAAAKASALTEVNSKAVTSNAFLNMPNEPLTIPPKSSFKALADNPLAYITFNELEPNDHFLGWQEATNTYRFCHHVDEAEINALVQGLSAYLPTNVQIHEEKRFSADGPDENLNRYLILRRVSHSKAIACREKVHLHQPQQ